MVMRNILSIFSVFSVLVFYSPPLQAYGPVPWLEEELRFVKIYQVLGICPVGPNMYALLCNHTELNMLLAWVVEDHCGDPIKWVELTYEQATEFFPWLTKDIYQNKEEICIQQS